jgi:hypothetical protein
MRTTSSTKLSSPVGSSKQANCPANTCEREIAKVRDLAASPECAP